jgi:CHASE1-domain containing sensor protein
MMARRKTVTSIGDEDSMPNKWHVNRGIPVVWLIGSLFIGLAQFGGLIWYASQFNTRVEVVEKVQTTATAAFEKMQNNSILQGERLTRLEEKVVAVQATANRIEALLTPVKTR